MAVPVNTVEPALSGTYEVGQTIYCSSGTWTGLGTQYTFTYQWQRNTGSGYADIFGTETRSDHVIASPSVGNLLRCRVIAENPDGPTTAYSAAVTPKSQSDIMVRVAGAWHGADWKSRVGGAWV